MYQLTSQNFSKTKYPNRWRMGQSGNPKGRPKTDVNVQHLAREHTIEAVNALMDVITNPKTTPNTQMRAAAAILSIAWTKPRKITGEDSPTAKMSIEEYVDRVCAARMGMSKELTESYCNIKKKEREYELHTRINHR